MPHPARLRAALLVPLLLAAALAAGCEEGVDPFLESDRYFTLYGTLDMNADSQFVRVIPIAAALEGGGALDATAAVTDLTTGEVVALRDSVLTFADGSTGHVFYAPLRVQPAHTYRLEVVRGDGAVTSAETTLPALPEVEVLPTVRSGSAYAQPVRWDGFDQLPFAVETVYRFLRAPEAPFTDVAVDYPTANRAPGEPYWQALVRLNDDRQELIEELGTLSGFTFLGIGMRLTLLDDQFVPPGGVFDPEVLVQPGTFSNVQNGFGFLGSVGRFSTEWVLPADVADALGLAPPLLQTQPEAGRWTTHLGAPWQGAAAPVR